MKKIKTPFLATLKSLLVKLESVRTVDGKDLMVDGELEVGKDILIDVDGEYEPAPSGEYDTGEKVIVVEAGRITEIREKEPEPEPEPEDLRKQSFNALREHFSQTYEERVRKIVAAIIALGYSDYGYVVEASDEHAVWAYWDDASQEEKFVSFSLVWADEEVTASNPVEVVPTFKAKDAADPADPAATAEMESVKAENTELKATVEQLKAENAELKAKAALPPADEEGTDESRELANKFITAARKAQ